MPDFMRILEGAIQYGTPTLLQNVHEDLDPSLEPILKKAVYKQGLASLILMFYSTFPCVVLFTDKHKEDLYCICLKRHGSGLSFS